MATPPAGQRLRIGAMLVAAGALSEKDLERALEEQKRTGDRLGNVLIKMGLVNEVQLTQMVSNQLSVPWVSLYHVEFSRELLNLVPPEIADRFCAIPIYVRQVRGQGSTLFVAMDDPSNDEALTALREASHLPVRAMVAPPTEIRNAIRVYYFGRHDPAPATPAPAPTTAAPRQPPSKPETAPQPPPPSRAASTPKSAEKAASPPGARQGASTASTAAAAGEQRAKAKPRMINLTLLDGTSISLPRREQPRPEPDGAAVPTNAERLTAKDLIAALDAATQGTDVSEILPDPRWEAFFAALLTLLLRKGLIADWEFIEEWSKRRR